MTTLQTSTSTSTAVFNSVTLPSTLTASQRATVSSEPNIDIKAYAIQTDNLNTSIPSEIFALFSE